jgi:hypothetical protein
MGARIRTAALVLAVAAGAAGCRKNDCHRLAELTCATDGTSAEDCTKAKQAARHAKTDAEVQACGVMLKVFQDQQKAEGR